MKTFKRIISLVFLPFVSLALSSISGIVRNNEEAGAVLEENDTHDHSKMTAWSNNNSLPTSGSYYLTTDVTIESTFNLNSSLDLCLNGHGIRLNGGGSVIKVGEGATLKLYDCDTTTEHKYSISNPASNGAGVATVNDSLTSNFETFTGGYITGGYMGGGYQYGAGINLEGNGATLHMHGGTIIGNRLTNSSTGGGGVCVQDWDKTGGFFMYGGSIIGNTSNYGGGVYVRCGKMELIDGNISKNVANGNIGGAILVFSDKSSLNIKGGNLNNNYAVHGGAIEVSGSGTVTLSGGNYMNNIATGKGGAITNQRNDGDNSPGSFNISGAPVFSGNLSEGVASDFYLCNTAVLNLTAPMSNTRKIGIAKASTTGVFTSGWSTHMDGKDPSDYFVNTKSSNSVILSDGEGTISSSNVVAAIEGGSTIAYYTDLNGALSAWVDGRTLKLLKDVNGQISISSGTKTLNLNNHSLTYTNGSVVVVSGGKLTLCDNSTSKTVHYYTPNKNGVATLSGSETDYYFEGGYVTGGVATDSRGGGLRVYGTGEVVFSSGTLFGNKAGWGGGIWSNGEGSVTIEDTASIIGNYSSGDYTSGGGIFMEGSCKVTMTGGSIRHNAAQYSGAGIRDCIKEVTGARFTMTGGEVTGNYSNNNQGNGFCFDQATTFNIGGSARIIGNQGTNDIYIYNQCYLTIYCPFKEDAVIGVTLQGKTGTFTSGWSTHMNGKEAKNYFASNEGYYVYAKNGEVVFSDTPSHNHSWSYEADGNVITATCVGEECPLSAQTLSISATSKIYDGEPVVATLSLSDDWTTDNGLEIPEIVYSGNTNVGKYTASVTLGDAVASVEFEISPAASTDVEVTGGISVDGLDEELNAIIEENPTANNVSLSMKIEEKEQKTAQKGDEIAEIIDNQVLSYFDITLEKTLDEVTTTMSETSTVLEIAFPFEKINKRNIQVYCYHGDEIRTFVESGTKADGTFISDKENKIVYVYTRSFSTYAIGYTPYYRVSVDFSFGIFKGKINVTLEDKNGEIVYKFENVDATNVVFEDVAMGQYKAIVSWAEGEISTSLAFNMSIGPTGVVITPISSN